MQAGEESPGGATVVGRPGWEAALVWLGFPALGGLLGLAVRPVAQWALDRDWMPLPGPFRLVMEIPQPYGTIGAVAAGVILGVVVALIAQGEVLRVAVGRSGVTLTRDEHTRTIERAAVAGAFTDGKELVVLGRSGEELAREQSDLAADRLEAAFTAHGYRWLPGDPHRDEYRRWVPETPELPAGAHAVFKARQLALEKGEARDVVELRAELAKLGVVVRDRDKRQHWRQVPPAG